MTLNFLLLPIIIPFFIGMVLMFLQKHVIVQRVITLITLASAAIVAFFVMLDVQKNGIQTVTFGDWPAPFGITMVADGLSSILVFTTLVLAFFIAWYSFQSIEVAREKYFYYPGLMFILTGVTGAFTTGDIFNLFVFFEVLLMSSYLLIVLGGEKRQLRGSVMYLTINVVSSALFVIAVAYLYSVVGTLSMADLAVKIEQIGQPGIITTIAVLFLLVFGLKAAIFPLYFWLPSSYGAAPIPVLALFGALLTKVGVYAITRTYTLLFVQDIGFTHELLLILSVATIVAGCIGALATYDAKQIIIYNIVIAVGVILFGVAQMNEAGLQGAISYLVHDMMIKAALFMLIGIVIYVTGTSNIRQMGGLIATYPVLGWFYLVAAFGLAGIPPLSGFVGKLLIVQGGFEADHIVSTLILLISSIIVLLSAVRIFIFAFWGEQGVQVAFSKKRYNALMWPTILLVIVSIAYGVGAEAVMPFIERAANALLDPSVYVDAVMKGGN